MEHDIPAQARWVLRATLKGSLATLDRSTGAPFVSMVSVATDIDGSPLLLISGLAQHTANIGADARVSLLLDTTDASGDPVSGSRLTVSGRLQETIEPRVRQRYLARQPGSAKYADFADFAFWRLVITHGHFIGGFGRIQPLGRQQLCLEASMADTFGSREPALLAEWQGDLPTVIRDFLGRQPRAAGQTMRGAPEIAWRMTGIDPEGADFLAGASTARFQFKKIATSIAEARIVLAETG